MTIGAHKVTELLLHITALIIFFHASVQAPDEQRPNAETNGIKQHRRFGIQGTHKSAGGNKTGKYQIDKRFHYIKNNRISC